MKIPYRKGLLSSDIDYEKLIEMQAGEGNQKDKNYYEIRDKSKVKTKAYQNKRMHRGGKR